MPIKLNGVKEERERETEKLGRYGVGPRGVGERGINTIKIKCMKFSKN